MPIQNRNEKIIIIDFGSQVTKLIARRIRDIGVFSEIITIKDLYKISDFKQIKGVILSGGPSTVTKKKYLTIPKSILLKKIPILGICYGLQLITKLFGGSIKKQNEVSSDKEELLSEIKENKQDHIIKEKDELSLEADISMKSVDKNNTEDTLDIPAFLRRQKE